MKIIPVPKRQEFYWPVIRALNELGGSATNPEMDERVVPDMQLPEEIIAVPHRGGTRSEVEYQLACWRYQNHVVG